MDADDAEDGEEDEGDEDEETVPVLTKSTLQKWQKAILEVRARSASQYAASYVACSNGHYAP